MENHNEIKSVLKKAGFSAYQAEIYVTLLPIEQAPVTKLTDVSSVPQPRIYDTLQSLEKDGYVNTYKEDVLYASVTDVSPLVEELREQADSLIKTADSIESIWERPKLEMANLLIFEQYDTLLDKSFNQIQMAENHIHLSVSPSELESLEDKLRAATSRGVSVHISIHDGEVDQTSIERIQGDFSEIATEVRFCEMKAPFLALIDGSLALFAVPGTLSNEYGLLVNDHVLTSMLYWYFQIQLWEFWNVVYSSEAPDVYMSIRELIRDVEAFKSSDSKVHVTVKGYDTSTGDFVERTGIITDTIFTSESGDSPFTYPFIQAAVILKTDEAEYTVGGYGAILEDLRAIEIVINSVEYNR